MVFHSINKFKLYFAILYFIACVPAPRYNSENTKDITYLKSNSHKNNIKIENDNLKKHIKKSSKKKKQPKFDVNKKTYKGISSFYGKKFHGKLTANGEVYDMYGLTAAHKTFPLNTICRVTNMSNSKSLILRINDRGPYVGNRILDCSYGAAKKLDFINEGVTEVKIEIMEWGDNIYMHHDRH
ncbi:MAG: hypothetical protein CMF96_12755 [Candidatus Marinimicrobia bacterium]|nr:hypothetical protein [Candidatus Neomarinimicrobiota bacterium]|tara:strand:+ start:216 stop:764 length:549 start_codon:yes stop_codon:yes gene_type:complete